MTESDASPSGSAVRPSTGAEAGPGQGSDLVLAMLRFCRALRGRGVLITPSDAADAVRALALVDLSSRSEVHLALRAVLIGRITDYPAYEELFISFWHGAAESAAPMDGPRPAAPPEPRRASEFTLEQWRDDDHQEPGLVGMPTFGDQDALAQKDFSSFGAQELEEITRVAARLARRLAARPGRRWRAVARGGRVDPRRTARQALRTVGEVVELSFRRRKLKKTKLILVCDVSGSMDLYARFLLQFLYALQNQFSRVETFVFSTRLVRITDQLEAGSYGKALQLISRDVGGWSGGTRIGECLDGLLAGWPRLLDRRTVVVVLSDGWDTGEPAVLSAALRDIRERAGKLIWLNPLLGSPDYQPLTRGMQAALPHVDVFASAHNLASLEALVGHLVL